MEIIAEQPKSIRHGNRGGSSGGFVW